MKKSYLAGAMVCWAFLLTGAEAATYYMAASGGSDQYPGTYTQPWATFAKAYSILKPGDTLILKDGEYTQRLQSYYGDGLPSGNSGAYITVRAENDFKAVVDGSSLAGTGGSVLLLQAASFITIQGIRFVGGNPTDGLTAASIIDSHHIKLLRCSFYGGWDHGNTEVLCIGPEAQDVLVEECHAWGPSRYVILNYMSQRVILRRCVSRHDYYNGKAPDADNQTATFTMYDSKDFLLQNCIAIDSGNNSLQQWDFWGGLWLENNEHGDTSGKVQGCVFLNLDGRAAILDPKVNGRHDFENTIIWNSRGGYSGNSETSGERRSVLSHCTIGEIFGDTGDFTYDAYGTGAGALSHLSDGRATVTDSILLAANVFGVSDYIISDYNMFFGNGRNYGSHSSATPTAGPHDSNQNPNMQFLLRAELGSPAYGSASDGGSIGATVTKRYGVSGTMWGEEGYDQLTDVDLWPFPNEDVIKSDMASYVSRNDDVPGGERGFCVNDTGLYGGPVTLTSYIWEYLGNLCPAGICDGATVPAPAPPAGVRIRN